MEGSSQQILSQVLNQFCKDYPLLSSLKFIKESLTVCPQAFQIEKRMRRSQNIDSSQNRQILQSLYVQFIKNNESITFANKQMLTNKLFAKNIEIAPIRTTLFREGESCHSFLYITEGSVTISKRISNKDKIVVASLTPGQIVNIEARINKWSVKYTAQVQSSELKYITFIDQQIFLMISEDELSDVRQLEKNRDLMIKKKLQQNKNNLNNKKKESLLNRISLPHLYIKRNLLQAITDPQVIDRKQGKSLAFNAALNNIQRLKDTSKQMDLKRKAQNQSIQLKKIEKVPSVELRRKQEQGRHSQKSLSVRQNQYTQRNQKLFKEQLKYIIKRKLLYERRHLTVLKAFRDEDRVVQKQEKVQLQPRQENKVDDYFIQQ